MQLATVSIWWWALGYFVAYVPYSALTKALSTGAFSRAASPPSGLELLPPSAIATVVTAFTFLAITGWWRLVPRRRVLGLALPMPRVTTLISGTCASGIIATTTLAYTFEGISIVFVMLLMRGGMLMMAPLIDRLHRRPTPWYSVAALVLSLAALLVGVGDANARITLVCAIDVIAYLLFYALRLHNMSRLAKSNDETANRRYFVEEQFVSSPALLVGLLIAAGFGVTDIEAGFSTYWQRDEAWVGLLIGVLSQFTGIFGGLVLLNPRENTFCIPVNRASSVLAGVVAAMSLALLLGTDWPGTLELVGAALIVAAITLLTLGPKLR